MNEQIIEEAVRWAAALFACIAGYYAFAFMYRYRRVNWEASPWGRHVMRMSLIIGVAMTTAVGLRMLTLWLDVDPIVLGIIGTVIYGWVAYEMRRRYYLEREAHPRLRPVDSETPTPEESPR